MILSTIGQGVLIGILVAAPIGPIGVLCMRASLISGFRTGFATGLGAAVVDGIFGLVAALFFGLVSRTLAAHELAIGLVGGAFVLVIAAVLWRQPPPEITAGDPPPARLMAGFLTGLGLTLVNPMTMMGFIAVFGGLGLGRAVGSADGVALLVVSIVLGSTLWWLFLAGLVSGLRHHLSQRLMRRINQGTAVLTGLLGIGCLVRAVL